MIGRRGAMPVACLWLCGLIGAISVARAQPEPNAQTQPNTQTETETYEVERLRMFLEAAGLAIDPAPEGKRIAYLRFERRRVFEPDDLLVPLILPRFASTWPNAFHWLTEESRIRREVLLRAGVAFRQRAADESARNLRDLYLFALVQIVAVKTPDPNSVGLVIYTRDLWSLRFEQSFAGAGDAFSVSAQLVERNFLGRGEQLGVRGSIDPLRFSAGQTFLDSRLLGAELRVMESFDVIFSRATEQPEGSTGLLRVGRPFYNLAQTTSYELLAYYNDAVDRDTRSGRVIGSDLANDLKLCQLGSESCVARVWRDRQLQLQAAGSYRVGERYKQTYTLGFVAIDRHVAPNAETGLRPDQTEAFARSVLPKTRRDIYPYVRYGLSVPEFVVLTNLASFGRNENVQVGPFVDGTIGVPLRAYGASSDGMLVDGLLSYIWSKHDALIDVVGEGLARLESGNVVDRRAILRLRGATPSYHALLGRFVLRMRWDVRDDDTANTLVALGGDNGLRGYPAQHFFAFGASAMVGNLEYRTRPWLLQSVHIGAVAFYDVGSVYKQLSQARLHQAAGAGLRVLFPQLNSYVFRLDVGLPLERAGVAVQLSYGSEQAVLLTAAEDAQAVGRQANSL